MQRHVESLRVFHATQGKHLGAARRHFQHRLVVDDGDTACSRHNARIGGEHAIDVGVDLAYVASSATAKATAEVSEPPRPSVVASPPLVHALEAGHNGHGALVERTTHAVRLHGLDMRVPNWARS